jgi:site-specific recombinase XerC
VYSPRSGLNLEAQANPINWVDAPKVPKRILPSLSQEDVRLLMDAAETERAGNRETV